MLSPFALQQVQLQPFVDPGANQAESLSLFVLAIVGTLTAVLVASPEEPALWLQVVISALLFATFLALASRASQRVLGKARNAVLQLWPRKRQPGAKHERNPLAPQIERPLLCPEESPSDTASPCAAAPLPNSALTFKSHSINSR